MWKGLKMLKKNPIVEGKGDIISMSVAHQCLCNVPPVPHLLSCYMLPCSQHRPLQILPEKKGIITVGLNERSLMGIPPRDVENGSIMASANGH